MNKNNRDKIKKILVLSILLAMGIVLNILDGFIPMPFGLKVGLSNIVGMFALYIFGFAEALIITVLRIVLATLFRGTFITFTMAFCGGVVAITVMMMIKKFTPFGKVVVSTIGALTHSVAQIIAATFIVDSNQVILMLPWMLLIAVPTGIIIGIISDRFIKIYDSAIKR